MLRYNKEQRYISRRNLSGYRREKQVGQLNFCLTENHRGAGIIFFFDEAVVN